MPFLRQGIIFPSERNDLKININIHHSGGTVCKKAGTGNHMPAGNLRAAGRDNNVLTCFKDFFNGAAEHYFSAHPGEQLSHFGCDFYVVRDSCGRDFQGAQAVNMGFFPGKFMAVQSQGVDIVFCAPVFKGIHTPKFNLRCGHQKLAALFDRQAVGTAECHG